MPVRSIGDKDPRIAATAWVSEAAYVVGDVEIGDYSSVWPGAVVRGDFGPIRIGANVHIEDNCVVHGGEPLEIGDNVIVGHAVVVHCRSVGSDCLIGSNSTLLDGTTIGDETMVAAGALVLGGLEIPEGSFVAGVPATVKPATEQRRAGLRAMSSNPDIGYGGMSKLYREEGL